MLLGEFPICPTNLRLEDPMRIHKWKEQRESDPIFLVLFLEVESRRSLFFPASR
jgi:hypothetical protein